MKFALIGTWVASRLFPRKGDRGCAGFSLLEALVALTLVVAFAAALGPYLAQARRIVAGADSRIAAQILLRSLIEAPLDRSDPTNGAREGENAGLRWRITTQPLLSDTIPPKRSQKGSPSERQNSLPNQANWTPFRLVATVSWSPRNVYKC